MPAVDTKQHQDVAGPDREEREILSDADTDAYTNRTQLKAEAATEHQQVTATTELARDPGRLRVDLDAMHEAHVQPARHVTEDAADHQPDIAKHAREDLAKDRAAAPAEPARVQHAVMRPPVCTCAPTTPSLAPRPAPAPTPARIWPRAARTRARHRLRLSLEDGVVVGELSPRGTRSSVDVCEDAEVAEPVQMQCSKMRVQPEQRHVPIHVEQHAATIQ
jgi:hypothetical protein